MTSRVPSSTFISPAQVQQRRMYSAASSNNSHQASQRARSMHSDSTTNSPKDRRQEGYYPQLKQGFIDWARTTFLGFSSNSA